MIVFSKYCTLNSYTKTIQIWIVLIIYQCVVNRLFIIVIQMSTLFCVVSLNRLTGNTTNITVLMTNH